MVGERGKVLPFFHHIDHAALQLLEREYRCFIVDKLAHKQVFKVLITVFAFELVEVEQGAATGKSVLNSDNLSPLAIVAELTTGERAVTDVDFDAVGNTAAPLVEQFARPEGVSAVRQCGRCRKVG